MADDPSKLTREERQVISDAGVLAYLHGQLPVVHPQHQADIIDAVHVIQRIVMSRVARRCNPESFDAVARIHRQGETDGDG